MNLEKFISFFNILKNIKRKLCEKKPKFIGNNFSLKLAAPPPRQTRSVFKSQIETDHKHRKPNTKFDPSKRLRNFIAKEYGDRQP